MAVDPIEEPGQEPHGGNGLFAATFGRVLYLNRGADHASRLALEGRASEQGLVLERIPCPGPALGASKARKSPRPLLPLRLALRDAWRSGNRSAAILSDCVELHGNLDAALAEIRLPDDWEMFVLGCELNSAPGVVAPGVVASAGSGRIYGFAARNRAIPLLLTALSESLARGVTGSRDCPDPLHLASARIWAAARESATYMAFPRLVWPLSDAKPTVARNRARQVEAPATEPFAMPNSPETQDEPLTEARSRGLLAEVWGGEAWRPEPARASHSVTGDAADDPGKVAFLFLTRADRNHPQIWDEYFAGHEVGYSVYAHAKDPGAVKDQQLREALIGEHLETAWGEVSLVKATLALLRAALADPANEFFALASESCVPVKPFAELRKLLSYDPRGLIGQLDADEMDRVNPGNTARILDAPRVPRACWMFHSQWFLLTRDMAEHSVRDDFTGLFEKSFAPDEAYFATVLNMKGFPLEQRASPSDLTFTRWIPELRNHPVTFHDVTPEFASELARGPHFLARKFAPDSNIGKYGLHLAGCKTHEWRPRRR